MMFVIDAYHPVGQTGKWMCVQYWMRFDSGAGWAIPHPDWAQSRIFGQRWPT